MVMRNAAKKKVLSSLCLVLPLLATNLTAGTGESALSLGELKEKCLEYSQNQQYREFKMKIECSGKYTYFEEAKKTLVLENESKMNAQSTTKSGLFQTEEKEYKKTLDPFQTSCSVWTKKEMTAPDGMGIPVSITSCEQLTAEFVQNRCSEELRDYCEDNFQAKAVSKDGKKEDSVSSSDASTAAGMCSLTSVEVVDTCSMYNN